MANRRLRTILAVMAALVVMCIASVAFAQTTEEVVKVNKSSPEFLKWVAVAAGFGIAIAALGGAYAQGKTASTALEGIARNPNAADKLFTPMILGLALIESLVIYALIISFLLLGKL